MGRRLTIVLVAMCLWVTAPSFAAGDTPKPAPACTLRTLASLDLEIGPFGLIFVPVSINGTDAWLLLNTGAVFSLLNASTVTDFNLEAQKIAGMSGKNPLSSGGQPVTQKATLNSLKLGKLEYKNAVLAISASTREGLPKEALGKPVVGTLGIDILSQGDFELNLGAKKLILFSAEHCPGNVVYWTKDYTEVPFETDPTGVLVFPIELDGHHIEATLATGTPISKIDSNITQKVYGFDESSPGITRGTRENGGEDARFRAMALTAPGLQIANTQIRLFKGSTACGQMSRHTDKANVVSYSKCVGIFPLSLGRNVLNGLRIYVSMKEKIIYISRADAT